MRNRDSILKVFESIFFVQKNDSLLLWEYTNKEILQKSPKLEEFLKKFPTFQVENFLNDLCTCFVKENLLISSQEKIEHFGSLEGKKYGANDTIYIKNLFFFLEDEQYILTQIFSLEELFQIELNNLSLDHLLCRVILNSNLEYVYTNRLYRIHTDYKVESGKNFFSIHKSLDFQDYLQNTLTKDEEHFFKNFPIQTHQNMSYWDVHIKKIALENFNQEFIAIQFVDQTEKFLFRNRERINQNLYYSILDSILDGVVCIDAKGTILFLNQSLSKMFGYESSELIYKNINILMPEEIAAKHEEFLENYHRGQGKGNIANNIREVQGKKKTGEIFPIELKVTKIHSQDSLLFLEIIRDLSHEKKMTKVIQEKEQEIYRLHNMELLGKMSSGIIHDISNFLQPLLFYTEIAEFEIKNMQSPEECFVEILKHLEKIKEFAFSIKNFTTEVLNFTKTIQPPKEKVPFAKYVKEIFEIFKLKHKDSFFYLDIEDSDKKVFISNESIFQIFSNLVTNAIHAMEEKITKQIFVKVRVCPTNPSIFHEFTKKYKEVFEVEFQDFGRGIPQENLPKIFEPFFTTKEKKKGTGLGLSIVNEIIKRHRGKIFVESKIGEGTKFTMYFLVSDENEKFLLEKIYSESNLVITKKSNIVILEPNEEIRTSFKKYLLPQINSIFLYSHYKEFLKYEASMGAEIDYLITEIFEDSFESFLIQFKAKYPNTKIIILTTREKRILDPLSKLSDHLYYKPISASELFGNVEI